MTSIGDMPPEIGGRKRLEIRWPETWNGWRTLFWLSIHRCPIHRAPLLDDTTYYAPRACYVCEGVGLWPRSAIDALRQNHVAWQRDQVDPNFHTGIMATV